MNGGKSRERRQCLHHDMIGYDWLCVGVIGSCYKSLVVVCYSHSRSSLNEQYNSVNGKTNKK